MYLWQKLPVSVSVRQGNGMQLLLWFETRYVIGYMSGDCD